MNGCHTFIAVPRLSKCTDCGDLSNLGGLSRSSESMNETGDRGFDSTVMTMSWVVGI